MIDVNRYAYCYNRPTLYVDPNGLKAYINWSDGRIDSTDSSRQFAEWLRTAGPGSIDNIRIYGHGTSHMMTFSLADWTSENGLNYVNGDVWIRWGTGDKDQVRLRDVLNADKFSAQPGSRFIALNGCDTAETRNSIARKVSSVIPNTLVFGPADYITFFPWSEVFFQWPWQGGYRLYRNGRDI